MTTTRIYTSADSGALQLSGEADKLQAVIHQCLVTGTGLSQPALGWSRIFTTTNIGVFQAPEGTAFPFRVDDNGPGAGTFKEARLAGAESWSSVSSGTNYIPSSTGYFVRKSATLDSVTRPYFLIGDERTVYLGVQTGDQANCYMLCTFGEFYSSLPSDAYNVCIIARPTENSAAVTSGVETMDSFSATNATLNGHSLARDSAGNVGAIAFGKQGDGSQGTIGLIGIIPGANTPDSRYYSKAIRVTHTAGAVQFRGRLRGLRHILHTLTSFNDGYTWSGAGDLAGRTFKVWKNLGNNNGAALFFTDSWEHN
jgi:hypothetical protein